MTLVVRKRVGAVCGFFGVAIWAVLYLVAALAYEGYDISENYLSDLGNPKAAGAWAFNAADVLAGLLIVPFALALRGYLSGLSGSLGRIALALAGVALIGVGIFPEESPYNLHFLGSLAFFLLLILCTGALIAPLYRSPGFGKIAGNLSALTCILAIFFLVTGVRPLQEHLVVYSTLVWGGWMAAKLWGAPEASEPTSPPSEGP